MVKASQKRRSKKWVDLSTLFIFIAIILVVNFGAQFAFGRFDLTSEKRYTLSDVTIEKVKNLEDMVFIRVYLDGNLPAEFRELRDATKETLDELRAYSNGKLEYEFIDPSASPLEEERKAIYEELTLQGLQYTNIRMRTGDKMTEQIIFPGAIAAYQGRETAIQLLKSQAGGQEQEMINASIQQLEYEMVSAIRKLSRTDLLTIALLDGYGQLDDLEVADAVQSLSEFYTVDRVELNEQVDALVGYKAAIIARPDSAFSEKDKFILDQFVMRGGRVLWFVDPVMARMDSLRNSNFTMGLVLEHNLTDQLFHYGARLNSDLVLDLQALPIPIVTGFVGDQPRQEMFPWFYSPLLMGNDDHPITKNIDRLKSDFVSTIDILEVEGVKGFPLLTSSEQTRMVNAPTRISFNILREAPRYELFSAGKKNAAVLLEGEFTSVFTNRLPKRILENEDINFREKSLPTKMIVCSDGDLIKNPVSSDRSKYFALGYDKYTNKLYGNREFLMNAMNYLCDDSGLLDVRSKEFKIRLLDQAKIDEERYFWQILNTVIPILVIFLFGIGRGMWRKRAFVTKA